MARLTACALALCAAILFPGAPVAQRAVPGTGGSLPLTDVMAFAAKYPNLVQQIRLQLLAAGLDKGKVVCSAERFSNQWPQLGGARIGPYVCAIGKRTLRITTAATYYDRNGHRLKSDDPMLAAKAARVIESGFKWTWK